MFGIDWAMLGLRLIGIGKWLKAAAAALIRWALDDPWRIAFAGALLAALWFHHGRERARAADARHVAAAARWRDLFERQKAEMLKFEAMVRSAREEAARLDRENVARVKRAQEQISRETIDAYRNDLDAARAVLADRLRRPGATARCAAGGDGAAADLPILSALPAGALRAGQAAIVDVADIDIATENTVRLERLIAAWRDQAAVDVNGEQ